MQSPDTSPSNVSISTGNDRDDFQPKKEFGKGLESEKTIAQPFSEFPEGGFAAWTTVLGAALIQFCGFGYTSSFGVYQDFFVQHYLSNESASSIAWIGSVNAFLSVACSIISGPLYDRGHFYYLVIGGSLLQSFSLFMLSLAKPGEFYQIFLTLGLGCGLAEGLMYVASIAVVTHYFQKRRTLVMTLVTAGSALGSVIHPIILNNLLNGPLGFANGVRISAALVTCMLLLACLLMRTRLPPPAKKVSYIQVAKRATGDSAFMLATTGSLVFLMGYYFPYFFLQLDCVLHGLNKSFSFYSLVILNASSFLGRLTCGFIVKYVEVHLFVVIAVGACTLVILGMIGLSSLSGSVLIAITFGYFAGVYIALASPLIASLTSDFSELGARMGIFMTIAAFGTLIGSPIQGALLGVDHVWWRAGVFSGIIGMAGTSLIAVSYLIVLRRRHNKILPSM
ncbi:major facilitator superfamily domain-containing protein [Hygrophoropsis aurantiaca]|uniref:Major facilitator superfamily domain-containing protein n=1 Tax=Hygrophoropsis aurantiaca TaxID=72124 RepID=A0ACB7ZQT5_9AGAM|nr:major facilitator superfamily domain-containing protein [Hygrophoropsis aurantiaca]